MADRVGQQFNSYRLTHLIGRGGFAEVYLGEHLYLGTPAAIKVLNTELTDEEVKRFRDEARTIATLRHPNIVRMLDFGVTRTTPFLIVEYAPNGTLRQRHPRGTRLSLATINGYVKQIASALQYIHNQQLIHRDLKPENLLLGPNQEVLLSDFGIALVAQTTGQKSASQLSGTVPYMAPEQLLEAPVHPAVDQYALGIVVYEWLCGEWPFTGSYREIATKQVIAPPPPLCPRVPGLSPRVEEVVLTALAKNPQERFGSVQAFARALEEASQAGPSASAGPAIFLPASGRPSSFFATRESGAPAITPHTSQPLADPRSSGQPASPPVITPQSSPLVTPSNPPGLLPRSGPINTPVNPPIVTPRGGPVLTPPILPRPGGTPPVAAPQKRRSGLITLVSALLLVALLGGSLLGLGVSGSGPLAFLHKSVTPAPTIGPTATATPNVPPGFQLYTSPDHTFRLLAPKGWQPGSPSDGGTGAQFQGPGGQVLTAVNKGVLSIDTATDDNSFCFGFGDLSNPPSPTRTVTINGHQWTQKDCNSVLQEHAIVESIVYKGQTFFLAYGSSNDTFDSNRKMFFTTVEQSFTFLI